MGKGGREGWREMRRVGKERDKGRRLRERSAGGETQINIWSKIGKGRQGRAPRIPLWVKS